ncbi:unnamed protein product [Effrenium voratum]|nr:unnamed protein product [Effrenium voratum]
MWGTLALSWPCALSPPVSPGRWHRLDVSRFELRRATLSRDHQVVRRRRLRACDKFAPEATATEVLDGVGACEVLAFPAIDGVRCVALVKGDIADEERVPVRVHSECLLGDVFSSRRCQCGDQLKAFMKLLSKSRRGAILYLQGQEGKGIGLSNKLKAYVLQDEGLDEETANVRLGFPPDLRQYTAAEAALRFLRVKSVILFSSSQRKISGLRDFVDGIAIWSAVKRRWEQ